MTSADDILITGVGVVSPIGIGREAYWTSLMEGVSGVRPIPSLVDSEFPVKFGAEVQDFEPKKYVKPRKSLKVMCREIQIGFSASTLALEDAALTAEHIDPDRIGVIYGSEMLYCAIDTMADVYRKCLKDGEFDFDEWGEQSQAKMYPLWMLMFLPNMTACHAGISIDARGPNNTIVAGDASSLLALIECVNVIRRGHADVMISGGVGSRINVTPLMYRRDLNLSHRNDAPEGACRPFDAGRDGMVNGEGGGALVLETRRHAEARGAKPLAKISRYGMAFEDCADDKPPTGSGVAGSIQNALLSSSITVEALDHVNAHGTSTIESDRAEAKAIRELLGDIPVTANKSYFGNLGSGSGAVELAASVLALKEGVTPPTLNYETPDSDCPVEVIAGASRPVTKQAVMKLSQSGHGQTAAVVIEADG